MKSRLGPFTGGQLTVIIVAIVVVIGLPVTAYAAVSFTNVSITDPTGTNRAIVDKNGALETRTGGVPQGAFSLSGATGSMVNVALPKCTATTCHYAITDVVLSQTNGGGFALPLTAALVATVGGVCDVNSPGPLLRIILGSVRIPQLTVTDVDFATPIVASGNPVCLVINASALAGLTLTYTVSGFRLTN